MIFAILRVILDKNLNFDIPKFYTGEVSRREDIQSVGNLSGTR